MMSIFSTGTELSRFRKNGPLPKAAIVVMLFIPLIYGALYLWAFWQPNEEMNHLPVALVNEDAGATQGGTSVNFGDDLYDKLVDGEQLAWQPTTEADARQGVADGDYYFSVTIPANFSANVVSPTGDTPESAQIQVNYNDSNSFLASTLGQTAMTQLRDTVRETVGEESSRTLLIGLNDAGEGLREAATGADTLADGLDTAHTGLGELAEGAATLDEGAATLGTGIDAANSGAQKLSSGSSLLSSGLDTASTGATQLSGGASELSTGVTSANTGAQSLAEGLVKLTSGSAEASTAMGKLSTGATQVSQGADGVVLGVTTLKVGADELATGASGVSTGATNLATGISDLKTFAEANPTLTLADISTQLTQLDTGATTLKTGAETLSTGAAAAVVGVDALKLGTDAVATGASQVATGAKQLAPSMVTLATKTAEASTGATQLAGGTAALNTGASTLASKSGELATGASTLASKTGELSTGASELATGTQKLSNGVPTLTDGASKLAAGAQTAADGSTQLLDGSETLATKLTDGATKLPNDSTTLTDEKAHVLANAVVLDQTWDNKATSFGEGFAPFFIALATFVGALITWLIMRAVPSRALAAGATGLRATMTALVPAAAIGLGQVVIMMLVLVYGIGLRPEYWLATSAFIYLVTIAFLAMQQAFIILFGTAAGRVISLVLLMLQLSSSGGTYPVQTTPNFFQVLHPYMPASYVVTGLRQLITGGVDSRFWVACAVLVGIVIGSVALSAWSAGRQRVWSMKRLHPALSI